MKTISLLRRRRGMTMIETVVVCLLVAIIIGTLMQIMTRVFAGTRKGYDTLSMLQEETRMVTFLKHDLRTMIISDTLPPPELLVDAAGLNSFAFHKVEVCDQYGMPVPVRIIYQREGGTRQTRHLDGSMRPVHSFVRTDGTDRKVFMKDMISSLSITLLDSSGKPCVNTATARKAHLVIETSGSELLQFMVSIYSPYLVSNASSTDAVWLNNFRTRSYSPGAGITTYNGVVIPAADLTIMGGAIGLSRERGL